MAQDYLREYYQVTVGSLDLAGNKDVTQIIDVCTDQEKYRNLLKNLKDNLTEKDRVLVFVETKKGCDMLTRSLRMDNFQARAMHGDKSQDERDWVLKEFKSCQSTLLVATDVAARGLDVDDIKMVVNFDFPNDMESYIHRIGRTGRRGKSGKSFSMLSSSQANDKLVEDLIRVLEEANQEVPEELHQLLEECKRGKIQAKQAKKRFRDPRFQGHQGNSFQRFNSNQRYDSNKSSYNRRFSQQNYKSRNQYDDDY